MEYLIPVVLVLLIVSGFVTFVVLRATRQSKPSEAENSEDADPSTMAATDRSPLGDTTEHAGEQSHGGETVKAPEGEGSGGERGGSAPDGDAGAREESDEPRPESERLADRHQV
jgi:hypothetical protein